MTDFSNLAERGSLISVHPVKGMVFFLLGHHVFDKMLLRFYSFHLVGFVCFSFQGSDQEALKKLVSKSHESKVTVLLTLPCNVACFIVPIS